MKSVEITLTKNSQLLYANPHKAGGEKRGEVNIAQKADD